MRACYHTHTKRCHHAFGEDEEYVISAIERGVKILGFSCHAPMIYPNGYVSYYKMAPDELLEYADSVLSLKEKYKGKIDIKLGLETEYYPELHSESVKLWQMRDVDYLILGQHFVDKEYDGAKDPAPRPSDDKERVSAYVNRVISAMELGIFTILAHPDLINYTGEDREFYDGEMRRLIKSAIKNGVYLEYNLLGQSDNRAYPVARFWQLVSELGAKTVLGCDAHSPERVAKEDEIQKAKKFLLNLGITPCDEIELIPLTRR